MANVTLNTIIMCGLLMAFLLPALTLVNASLPTTGLTQAQATAIEGLNSTGNQIVTQFNGTYKNLSDVLIGSNCAGPGNSNKTCTPSQTGFGAAPNIVSAFAFILSGIGTVMIDIIQIPTLDYKSLQLITSGTASVIGGSASAFLTIGVWLLYLYMGISILLIGTSLIQKYDARNG